MKIISFDGIRASGKSSQLFILAKTLSEQGKRSKIIHEKDYEPFRSLVLEWNRVPSKKFNKIDSIHFAKARNKVCQQEIYPFLDRIDYFLFDRYFYTSAVYQQGILSMNEILYINLKEGILNPDKSFIFVCDPYLSFERMNKRKRGIESLEEITKRRSLYIQLCEEHPELDLIDTTSKSEEEVFEEVKERLRL